MIPRMPRWQSYVATTTQPIFTPEQCKMIIDAGHQCAPEEAKVGGGEKGKYDTNFNYKLFPVIKHHRALAAGGTIWDPELQKMAHYRDFIVHPNPKIQERWIKGGENEFGRLFIGYGDVE